MKPFWFLTALLALTAGCAPLAGGVAGSKPTPVTARAAGVPAYRFVRAPRASSLAPEAFAADLAGRWLPSLPRLHGLVSYVSAMPPASAGLPDEIALVAYESPEAHDQAWASEQGRRLASLQGALFAAGRMVSTPVDAWPATGAIAAEVPYDVMRLPTDWQSGYTTWFIGRRRAEVPAGDFLARLGAQVARERAAFAGKGLSGYVFLATEEYKLSFMHWDDMAAFGRAMQSSEGQAVVGESQALMRTVQFASAAGFRGAIAPGRVVTLHFER